MLLNDKLMSEITVNEFFAVAGHLIGFIVIGIIILYGFYEMVSFTSFLLRRKIYNRDLRKELERMKKINESWCKNESSEDSQNQQAQN